MRNLKVTDPAAIIMLCNKTGQNEHWSYVWLMKQ